MAEQVSTSGNDIYYINGNVGISTNKPKYNLDISGNMNITGSIYMSNTSNLITNYYNKKILFLLFYYVYF